MSLESRFEGCILGLAIGDALGHPTEFLSLDGIHERYGPEGVVNFETAGSHPPGTYTDDTQMSIAGAAWVGEEAVADALHCFLRAPGDFRSTVLTGANSEGDSDSIACIAGAMSGAHNGIAAIPRAWRAGVENAAYLRDLAARLHGAVLER